MANDVIRDIVEVDELRESTQIDYAPVILALTNQEQHSIEVDVVNLKDLDLSKSSVTPQVLTEGQTEVHHIKVGEKSSKFNILVKGNKIYQSGLRGRNQLSKIHNKVIYEYSKIFDNEAMNGANGNNGVFNSIDENYVTKPTVTITDANDLVSALTDVKLDMNNLGSQDIIIYVYGRDLQKYLGTLTANDNTIGNLFQDAYPNATLIDVPTDVSGAAGNGFIAVARNLVTLHTSVFPDVEDTDYNKEGRYEWANYIFGSTHVTVDQYGAITKQPVTLA